MKRITSYVLMTLFTFCFGVVAFAAWSFFGCKPTSVSEGWKTYESTEYGYRIRYPEDWRPWGYGGVYLCSPRITSRCGLTPHEVYATVEVAIKDPEGLQLVEYLRSPARGYTDLRELRLGGVQAFATGPVDQPGRFISSRFIDEQVHVLQKGRVYTITAYAQDYCSEEFERVLTTFEFTK